MEDKETAYKEALISLMLLPFITVSVLWKTYILWSICEIYHLYFLLQYGYEIFLGSVFVLGLITAKYKSDNETPKQSRTNWLMIQIGYFLIWGLAWLFHKIIF